MKNLLLIFVVFICSNIYAQEVIDENALFPNPEIGIGTIDNKPPEEEKKSVGFSGEITSVINNSQNNQLSSYILGNFLIDARLKKGTKGFTNIETKYTSELDTTNFILKELFLDFNIKNKVYFRAGKQVLQWGRCYLWNPTDLVNIEKKTFEEKIGAREGAYGIKMHIPFDTKLNIYSFARDIDSTAITSKVEFLVGNTEMAFAVWGKKGFKPVYGYDFSTRLFKIDTYGELSASRSRDKWDPEASIGFNKSFDFRDVNDRITTRCEFYYNTNHYAALFASYKKFIISDLTLNMNLVGNLNDHSSILSSGVNYEDLTDFNIGLTVYSYLGPANREYTPSGNGVSTQLTVGIVF